MRENHQYAEKSALVFKLIIIAMILCLPAGTYCDVEESICTQIGDCVHGVCKVDENSNKGYRCLCTVGWTGTTCEQSKSIL